MEKMVPRGLSFDLHYPLTSCQQRSKRHSLQESSILGQKLENGIVGGTGTAEEGSGPVTPGTNSDFPIYVPNKQLGSSLRVCVNMHA